MHSLLRVFASSRLTLGVLGFLVVYSGFSAWAPDTPLERLLGPHPFSAPVFVAAILLLFLCTLSCTWLRTEKVFSLWQGEVPSRHLELQAVRQMTLEEFLREQGFRGRDGTLWRNRPALWSGWLLHLALLILMIGTVIQLSFHDGGAFELAVGETVFLARPGTVFDRTPGTLASDRPPDFKIRLVAFDAHLHQPGFAPDRRSLLVVETGDGAAREVVLDRAAGVTVQGTTFFQAMPTGVAVVLELPGNDLRAIHLKAANERLATADLTLPGGAPARFAVESERAFDDRRGSGSMKIRLTRDGVVMKVSVGDTVEFGNATATVVDLVRWSAFTFVRSPGMPAVFTGFALVLTACVLLIFPSGIAGIEASEESAVASVWLNRGSEVMEAAWRRGDDRRTEDRPTGAALPSLRHREDS